MVKYPSVGLIAGEGAVPLFFARQVKAKGLILKTVAIRGAASASIEKLSDETLWISVGQLGSMLSFFKAQGVKRAVMHGKVQHSKLFKNIRLDWKALSIWARLKDRSGEALLRAVAVELEKIKIKLLDSRYLMEDAIAQPGWLTPVKNDREISEAIAYGLQRARFLARSGVGQTLMVKRNAVVAVEAMEGTDETIRRSQKWGGAGSILVKVASPQQDWRFDVPTIGLRTVRGLIRAKAKGMVIEGGKTFLLKKQETVAAAKEAGLFILAV
jgi:UDP-2,3-diacylglucosamine hydrolase